MEGWRSTVKINSLAEYIVVVCPALAFRHVDLGVEVWVVDGEFVWVDADDWACLSQNETFLREVNKW